MSSLASSSVPVAYGRGNVKVCRRGCILVAALDRPRVRNAFHDDLYLDLVDLLQEVADDSSIHALVLTGNGEFFSSGADVKGTSFQPRPEGRNTLQLPAGRFMMALIRFPKVLVAAVQGPAVGIAVTLLLHCDLVLCTPNATFWAPFTRLALVPELCSSVTFAERMGLAKANELLLLGKQIDAQKAYDWNLCSQVVPDRTSNDPFHPSSLAMYACEQLEQHLLGLPQSARTSAYFTKLIKGTRAPEMEEVCKRELLHLDDRFNRGDVQEAALQLRRAMKRKQSRL